MSTLDSLECGTTIEEIDKAFVTFGTPVGPIRLTDEVHIDMCYNVIRGRNLEQDTLKNLVQAVRFGLKKSAKGFSFPTAA
jgi:3-hydroxyacyl-CoA dehydrogenase